MGTFKNEFSWSKSRDENFNTCRRQYFYHYYGSWGGWERDADERTRQIYVLKQLQTRPLWAGTKVHDCIKVALSLVRAGQTPISKEQAIERTLNEMRNEFRSSLQKHYWKFPKSRALFEHEYEVPITDEEWKDNANHVTKCLTTFFDSNIYKTICNLESSQWLEVEEFSSFQFEGTKIHAVMDFSYRDGDKIFIYDWKSGKAESEMNKVQLACYRLYASQKWKVSPENIKTIEFNLPSNTEIEYPLDKLNIEEIEDYMRSSIKEMTSYLESPKENKTSEEKFPYVENERTCNRCNFKKICTRWT